ncbi:MAG: vanadium-dependent haloperoxidase [Bdellovibrionales bacterium]|nr:vanadium-dependent haloperoxidase [Bdellovibrionales bacterium]
MLFPKFSRRTFFRALSGAALGAFATKAGVLSVRDAEAASSDTGPSDVATSKARAIDVRRYARALKNRLKAYRRARKKRLPTQRANRDVRTFGPAFGYTKVLPKDDIAEPSPAQFRVYQQEIKKGKFQSFEDNVASGAKGFKNPIGAHCTDLQGFDASQFSIPPAPAVESAEASAEIAELYWMALCRDVSFSDYETDSTVSSAISDLNSGYSDFRGAKVDGLVTPGTLFRSGAPGRLIGPYVSQLLLLDVATGRLSFDQRQQTTKPGSDWMTRSDFFNFRQGGNRDGNEHVFDETKRYIRNGRDLAMVVWDDKTFSTYLHGFYILFNMGISRDSGNPYTTARVSTGFVTGDYPQIMSELAGVILPALKAAWWQKWNVHLRIRPEEFAGRIHYHKVGATDYSFLSPEILESTVLEQVFTYNGLIDASAYPGNGASYLLPMAYPEGCPNHPSYPSGHAVMAGAAATLLKAHFDENEVIKSPMIPNADGTALEPYTGGETLTVGNEINKLASNICEGRNWAGLHYRSDMEQGLRLGEKVAIELLRE